MLSKCIILGCIGSETWSKSIEIDDWSSSNGANSTISHWSSGSDIWSHPSSQSNNPHPFQSWLKHRRKKQASFLVQISNIGLSKLQIEWKRQVTGIVFHSHACECSMPTTSQKYLSMCLFLANSTRIVYSSPITDVHHLTIDWAFQIVDTVDNFNSFLRRDILTHDLAPSCSSLPCRVSK